MIDDQIWKDIPEYNGEYQVSNKGLVRSLKNGKERILYSSMVKGRNKPAFVTLSSKERGQHTYTVDYLVAKMFMGETPLGHCIAHRNNDTNDNMTDNLYFKKKSLTREDRRRIKILLDNAIKEELIMKLYPVTKTIIKEIGNEV